MRRGKTVPVSSSVLVTFNSIPKQTLYCITAKKQHLDRKIKAINNIYISISEGKCGLNSRASKNKTYIASLEFLAKCSWKCVHQ